MPRILVAGFCAFPGPDRAGVQLRHVVRALLRGGQVDVLTARRGDQAYVERWHGARLLRVPGADGPFQARVEAFRRALRRQLEGADYHAIHVRDGFAGQVALEQARRLKLAVVFDATRAPLSQPGALEGEAAATSGAIEAELLRTADLVLVGSEAARDQVIGQGGDAHRVHVVPPGVDVDAFDWEEPPPGRPRILHLGALEPGRGTRVLVRAMLDVVPKVDAELVLAGPAAPGFLDGIRNAIRDLGLAERVVLLGEVPHDQVPALIGSAQICVATAAAADGPLPYALYPTKLLEFMACQRAVVAPRRACVRALITDEQHGLLYEPGQPLELADQLLRLLGDGELRARVAAAGYELVRRGHTASGTRRAVRKAYAYLAGLPAFQERFAEALEDVSIDEPAPTGDLSSGGGLVHPRAAPPRRAISAFDDGLAIDEDDGAPVDTGLNEGFGEVTKVEAPPLGGYDDRAPAYQPLSTVVDTGALGDDWVVEDSRIRDPLFGNEKTGSLPSRYGDRTPGPFDGRFVAGELEVPPVPRTTVEVDQAFVAIGPPLGFASGTVRPDETRAQTVELPGRAPSQADTGTLPRAPEPPSRERPPSSD